MNVNHQSPNRRIIAFIGHGNDGVFLPSNDGYGVYYITNDGRVTADRGSWEDMIKDPTGRKPVYEGDSITLTF